MRRISMIGVIAAGYMVAGCGGGGGGGVSPAPAPPTGTPSPTPTPTPPPAATSFAVAQTTATYAGDGAANEVAFNLTSQSTITGRAATGGALTIGYDAPSNSYTVSSAGRSQTFAAGDIQSDNANEVIYRKTAGATRDQLTLAKIPYTSTEATQHVRLGFWQRNEIGDARQDTLFSAFAYGFPTPAAAVPRSGFGTYTVHVFGLAAAPGFAPRSFQGRGEFDIDFVQGVFQMDVPTTEYEIVTDGSTSGGGLFVKAGGRVASGDGSFSGSMLYGGSRGRVGGSIAGRFYGPTALEIGASFSGANTAGATVTGALTGQGNPAASVPSRPLTLAGITGTQSFFVRGAALEIMSGGATPGTTATANPRGGRVEYRSGGNYLIVPEISSLPTIEVGPASVVSTANSNFTAYQVEASGQTVGVQLYKAGTANSELALTYASLGRYQTQAQTGMLTETRHFFTFGLETPAELLSGRTGSGVYEGVVYGAAANGRSGARYDVTGTSRYEVDFSQQRYTGRMGLLGAQTSGGSVDFGAFDFNGSLTSFPGTFSTGIQRSGVSVGDIESRFYGPEGQEIGSRFTITLPDGAPAAGTSIAGVTVAKRQ